MGQEEYEAELKRIVAMDLTKGEKLALSVEAFAQLVDAEEDDETELPGRYCDHCGRLIVGAGIAVPPWNLCLVVGEDRPTCWDLVELLGEPVGSRLVGPDTPAGLE